MTELETLARPPAVYPAELRLAQQWQAVWRQRFLLAEDAAARGSPTWAVIQIEWLRRKREAAADKVGIDSLQVAAEDDFASLKLPRHTVLALRRAREGTIPELHRDRSHKYMTTILEKARRTIRHACWRQRSLSFLGACATLARPRPRRSIGIAKSSWR